MKRVWEPLTGDSTDYGTLDPRVGIWVYNDDGSQISISTSEHEIFALLPDNIRLCIATELDEPALGVPEMVQVAAKILSDLVLRNEYTLGVMHGYGEYETINNETVKAAKVVCQWLDTLKGGQG